MFGIQLKCGKSGLSEVGEKTIDAGIHEEFGFINRVVCPHQHVILLSVRMHLQLKGLGKCHEAWLEDQLLSRTYSVRVGCKIWQHLHCSLVVLSHEIDQRQVCDF